MVYWRFSIESGCGAARLARLVRDQEVPGSNPGAPTKEEALFSMLPCFVLGLPSHRGDSMITCYILQSKTTSRFYVGSTENPENRLQEHNAGETRSTRHGVPWEVIWTEEFPTRVEAGARERQIKGRGIQRFLDGCRLHQPG
jgi:putative endonuclease